MPKHIRFFRRLAAAAMSLALLAITGIPVMAADISDTGTGSVTGNVAISGTVTPLTISVTHPATVAYAIDPNAGTFTAPDIVITNNTKVPVNVTVSSLAATSGGSITFTDVAPSSKPWASLNAADSKKYIALGVEAKNSTGWNPGYATTTHWASDATPLGVGELNSGAAGKLSLDADFGSAFDGSYTANHSLVLKFSLV